MSVTYPESGKHRDALEKCWTVKTSECALSSVVRRVSRNFKQNNELILCRLAHTARCDGRRRLGVRSGHESSASSRLAQSQLADDVARFLKHVLTTKFHTSRRFAENTSCVESRLAEVMPSYAMTMSSGTIGTTSSLPDATTIPSRSHTSSQREEPRRPFRLSGDRGIALCS